MGQETLFRRVEDVPYLCADFAIFLAGEKM